MDRGKPPCDVVEVTELPCQTASVHMHFLPTSALRKTLPQRESKKRKSRIFQDILQRSGVDPKVKLQDMPAFAPSVAKEGFAFQGGRGCSAKEVAAAEHCLN